MVMKSNIFLILFSLTVLSKATLFAQGSGEPKIEKRGWLLYYSDKIIWFESEINSKIKVKSFFKHTNYKNGLIVNYIEKARLFRSVALAFGIKVYTFDTSKKREGFFLDESIWLLPVSITYEELSRPVSDFLKPVGLTFKYKSKNVTIDYNFEANYDLTAAELLRKKDRRRLKRVTNYVVWPPH